MSETNTMLREAISAVVITGILKKKELEIKKSDKGEAIVGHIIVDTGNGNEVRIDTYVNRMTKGSADKPSQESSVWKNQLRVIEDYVSVAECMKNGDDLETARAKATRFTVKARLDLNDYPDRSGAMVSMPRINANFSYFTRIGDGQAFEPSARFEVEGFLEQKRPEMKGDDETGRLILELIVPGYQGAARPMTFVTSKEAAPYIEDHYDVGTTIHVYGEVIERLDVATIRKAGFMREEVSETTTRVSELLIDNGDPEPYEEDSQKSYTRESIQAAMRVRELEYLPAVKQRATERSANKGNAAGGGFAGFAGKAPQSNTGFKF